MRLRASQLSGSVGSHGMLESEGDWLPGVRVSPPWPYLIRLPLLRAVTDMADKRVYRLTQNSGFVKVGGAADWNVIRQAGCPGRLRRQPAINRLSLQSLAVPGRGSALRGWPWWVHRPVADADPWPGPAPVRSAAARRPTVASRPQPQPRSSFSDSNRSGGSKWGVAHWLKDG